jgi:Leucine-rich repeat (LRR) protein
VSGLQIPASFCYDADMPAPTPTRRHFLPTPAWLIYGLLVVEGLLWLSERYRWFWFNEHKGWTVLIAVASVGVTMLIISAWFLISLFFRWRFQFSIRWLLVLTLAVALPCSWLAVRIQKAKRQQEVAAAIESLGGQVHYDWQLDANRNYLPQPQPPGPAWLRNLLPNAFFDSVVCASIGASPYGEAMPEQVSDATIEYVKGLIELQRLDLNSTSISDVGLEHLKGLHELEWLDLNSTSISDAGLEHLEDLHKLEWLDLARTKVTDAGVKKLQQALPKCMIVRE